MFWWVAEILGPPQNPEVLLYFENATVILGVRHRRNAWACAKLHLKLPRQMSRARRFFVFMPGLILLKSHVTATGDTGRLRDSWVGIGINSSSALAKSREGTFRAESGAAAGQQGAAADQRSSAWAASQEKSLAARFLPRACKVCVSKPPQS